MSASSSVLAASGSTTAAAPSITPLKESDDATTVAYAEEPAGAVEEETETQLGSPAEVGAAILDAKQELGQKGSLHDSNPDANQKQEIDSVEETIAKFQARWPYWVAEYESEMRKQRDEPPPAPTSPRLAGVEFLALVESLKDHVQTMQLETTVDDDREQWIESIQKTVDRCMWHVETVGLEVEAEYCQKWHKLTRLEQEKYADGMFSHRNEAVQFDRHFMMEKKAERDLQETSRLQRDAEEELKKIRQEKIEKIKRAAEQERERLTLKSGRGSTLVEDGFPECPRSFSKVETFACTSCVGFQVGTQRPEDCIFRSLHTLPPRKFADGVTWNASKYYSRMSAVHDVMTEVARTYQQSCEIRGGKDLVDSNPSFSVSRSAKKPIAVIHVEKKEYEDIGARAYQHASKYLANLRLDCGVSAPIGIVTSYDKWQFCWHKYASPVAEATTIEEVQRFCAPAPVDADFSLCVSPVYSYDNPCLLQLLASFLVKVAHIPSCAPVTKPWLLYTPNEQFIRLGRLDPAKVRHYDMVPESANELFWVKLMGRDSEGLVLQMATENGECCAAKFCEPVNIGWIYERSEAVRERQRLCQEERDRWVEAYGKDCGVRVSQLIGRPVVLMPFYEPLSDADWEAPGTMDMVMDHFKELATRDEEEETRNGTGKRKVFHINIERRHVMWGDKDHTCVRLIDWGQACKEASLPETSRYVRRVLDSDKFSWYLSHEKEARVSSLVQDYLAAAKGILRKPARAATVDETVKVITVPQAEDDFGEAFKIEFKDPFAELYDRDRAAFHAEMRKYWDRKE